MCRLYANGRLWLSGSLVGRLLAILVSREQAIAEVSHTPSRRYLSSRGGLETHLLVIDTSGDGP